MSRTTTFRSSYLNTVAGLALLALAAPGLAQETPAASQDRLHVVQRGETLWDLAQRYYSDPFLWPEIYRLNTVVIEDPHWIFPGEELQLASLEEVSRRAQTMDRPGVPQRRPRPPAAPASGALAPTVFSKQPERGGVALTRIQSAAYRHRALRPGEFYSAGFLTENEEFPWARVLGAVGKPTLKNLTASSGARIYDEVELEIRGGTTYAVGDSLLVASLAREIPNWGHIVSPTGLARVSAVGNRRVRAQIIAQFDRVSDGQVALPAEQFIDPGDVVPVPVDNGITGAIVAARHVSPVGQQLGIVYVDLGRSHGVALGDIFEILRIHGTDADFADVKRESVGRIQIVHVRERSASGIVTRVFDLGIEAGAPVRLARKMPS